MSFLLLGLFGCMTGISTVLFGFGGGFVVVPLVYRLMLADHPPGAPGHAVAMQVAVATSTAVMVIGASLATFKQHRGGHLPKGYLWPLAGYIALGAGLGALLTDHLDSNQLRLAFMAYLGLTITDCLLRRGFVQAPQRPLALRGHALKGVVIGTLATMLGVGGSVMTVPLMRRAGLSMAQATALANPLALPVAVVGSLLYAGVGREAQLSLADGFVGYVYWPAFLLLALGSWLGVRLALPFAGKIADRLHARIYVALLLVVLLVLLG